MWLNYDDQYAVSADGYVMNRKTGQILKGFPNNFGYLQVKLYRKNIDIHRIVALRFCPKIDLSGLEVDHINRDRADNRAANLRWCSPSQNNRNRECLNIYRHSNSNGFQDGFEVGFI